MRYAEAVRYLDQFQGQGIQPGLRRMRGLLRELRRPYRSYRNVLVAGTNGKGSTAATLASILNEADVRVGFYSSPHLLDLRERWQIGREPISRRALAGAVVELQTAIKRSGIRPTYFEALTVVGAIAFRDAGCELVVWEVGMGGRLDATNVFPPAASVITSISIDHVEFLGRNVRSIAREKAGIIHRDAVALTSNRQPEVLSVLRRRARSVGVPLHVVPREVETGRSHGIEELQFTLRTPRDRYRIVSPLRGDHQIENTALAVRTAEELAALVPSISRPAIERGVRMTRWRGRLETFRAGTKHVIVDGGHNEGAAQRIAEFVTASVSAPRLLVFAIMRDKAVDAVTRLLFPLFDGLILTTTGSDRTADPQALAASSAAAGRDVRVIRNPRRALRSALDGAVQNIVVCGSLYLAGTAIDVLDRQIAAAAPARRSAEPRKSEAVTSRRRRPKVASRV